MKMGQLFSHVRVHLSKGWMVGVAFFLYSLLNALAFQQWVVPRWMSHIDLGYGLIVQDSVEFHRIAVRKATEIRSYGWLTWELLPQGQFPAGVASFFYALVTPDPWVMLPFNALVHAFGGFLIFWILRYVFPVLPSLVGSLLFLVNPAALEWTANIHRDGVFILGNLLVLAGFVVWSAASPTKKALALSLPMGMTGTLLVWCSRPYWMSVLWLCSCLLLGLVALQLLRLPWQKLGATKLAGKGIALAAAVLLLVFQHWMMVYHGRRLINRVLPTPSERLSAPVAGQVSPVAGQNVADLDWKKIIEKCDFNQNLLEKYQVSLEIKGAGNNGFSKRAGEEKEKVFLAWERWEKSKSNERAAVLEASFVLWWTVLKEWDSYLSKVEADFNRSWIRSDWLPEGVEKKIFGIAGERRGVSRSGGKTVIDAHIRLNSAEAFLAYLPRALQVGLLSPFPDLWCGEGSTEGSTMARRVLGLVTPIFWLCLLGVPIGLARHRNKTVAWVSCGYCMLGLLLFTYAYSNVGTMMRFRYGFYMFLVAFGFATWMELWLRTKRLKN